MPRDFHENYIKICIESIRITVKEVLVNEIIKEIRDELKQKSEEFVIKKC